MTRDRFLRLTAEALDSLPDQFRERIHNVAVLVEDEPREQALRRRRGTPAPRSGRPRRLLMGKFVGVPRTHKSFFDLPAGPDHIVLYQRNIEAVSNTDAEVREQIRRTVIHEFGHYFGMDESQLWDV
jgi:predicted Zn-dependent protease with MMP-like domain